MEAIDLLIIGAGPIGLACGIEAASVIRLSRRVAWSTLFIITPAT